MAEAKNPTLRELIETRIDYEKTIVEQRLNAIMELIKQKFEMLADNLTLQAKEYERRMTALNHAHEAAVKEQARVLTKETYDAFMREYNIARMEYVKQIENLTAGLMKVTEQVQGLTARSEGWTATSTRLMVKSGTAPLWLAAAAVIIAVLAILKSIFIG